MGESSHHGKAEDNQKKSQRKLKMVKNNTFNNSIAIQIMLTMNLQLYWFIQYIIYARLY